MRNGIVAGLAALAVMAPPALAEDKSPAPITFPGFNETRAQVNYRALLNGTRRVEELSYIERREVAEIDRRVRLNIIDKRTPRQKCIDDEIKNRGGSLTKLEEGTVDLACSQR